MGNLLNETDPEGNATAYEYDPVGRMTAVTDALGATTRYEYNAADKLAKVIDALGHETSYTYDATGNLASETDALGNTVKYSYTPEGWLETITDAEGHVTRYTYDRTGNVLTADYAGEQTETNTYNELGLLTTVTTAEGDTLYQYDDASRLISVTQPNGETVSYTYDSRGNRATMTYPNGKTAKYTYDDMNRLVSVKGVDGITTKYKYDALGRRIATNGAKEDTVYTYDEVGNLVRQTTTGAYDLALEYAYDLSGRMTQESRTKNGATLDSVFTYDPLGQLTGFTRSDGQSESYAYDPVGNMTAKTQNSVKTAMTYNAANQLISSVSGTDKTTYSYDANGNLVKSENAGGARSYTYNARGLLAQFTREDGYSESYTYNANKLLSGITNNTGTTALTYDILYGDGVVISSARNGEQTSYTYGLERISAQTGKTRTEYVYDGRGSVAAEVSYNNAWYTFGGGLAKKNFTTKSYTPFGEQIGEATSGFGYNGEYYNAASGMIYLRARFYAPEMNRFSQKDILRGSILQPGSLNRYLYVQNDPVNFVDPSGMRQVAGMYGDGAGRTSTTRSSSRTSYTPPSYPAPSGPARSTASSVNPYNTVRATSQAISDARRAADVANSQAPGSPAAYRATQAYYETQRLAAQAVASHNTQAGIKAVQTSQASVNYVNNVVTGRAPNTYSPYDPHGNVYSYYNSSYDTGKIPSPDAPRIEDIDADSIHYCESVPKETKPALTQTMLDKLKQSGVDKIILLGTRAAELLKDIADADLRLARAKSDLAVGFVSQAVNSLIDIGGFFVNGISLIAEGRKRDTSIVNQKWEDFASNYVSDPHFYNAGKVIESVAVLYAGVQSIAEGLSGLASVDWKSLANALKLGNTGLNPVLIEGAADALGVADVAELLKTGKSLTEILAGIAISAKGGADIKEIAGKGTTSSGSSLPVKEKTRASNGLDYQSNPKHTPGQAGYRADAGVEPKNSLELFEQSVSSAQKPGQRFTYDETTGTLHRFFDDGNGTWHWSGSTNQGINSLTANDVPIDIRRIFGLPGKGW